MSRAPSANADLDVDLRALFASLRRNWLRVLGLALVVGALAFALAVTATPQYRSEARVLIETRESAFTRPSGTAERDTSILDEEGVTSQVEVITSTEILASVARQFNLAALPEFNDTLEPSLKTRLLDLVGLGSDPVEMNIEDRVLRAFRDKLQVFRVERSRVIVVQFSSEDPQLAAKVPNAVADAFINVQRDAKLDSNADATAWLEPEIASLTERVREAEAKVAQFRSQSDLLVGQNNSVLATQQLSEVTSELSRVRAARGAAEAAASSVRSALDGGGSLDALPDVLRSALIQRLRERQVQLRADIADLSTTLLDNHPRIRALRSQLSDLDAQIAAEGRNVLRSLATEAETARLREEELVGQLNSLKVASARAGEQEVDLRALEREAASQRQLLETYLTRFREASSRRDGNYLPADARVISRAVTPSEAYFPKVLPITVAAFVAALLLMAVITLLTELFSGRAMRPAAGSREPDAAVAGPVLEKEPVAAAVPVAPVAEPVVMPLPVAEEIVEEEPVTEAPLAAEIGPAADEVGVKAAAEMLVLDGRGRAVFLSPEGDEATVVSVMVAREVADTGLKTLLVDCSATGAASLPMLENDRLPGLSNLLVSGTQIADVIHPDLFSDCHVIPMGTADPEQAGRAVHRLPMILDALGSAYDLVVVEGGATDVATIRRFAAEAGVFVSAIGAEDGTVANTLAELAEQGFEPLRVTPAGYEPPERPEEERDAAA